MILAKGEFVKAGSKIHEVPRESVTIQVARRFAAPAETVFDAWLDPKLARKFLFTTPTGTMKEVAIDARVGGTFTIIDTRDGQDVPHRGEYLAIDRPHHLVFTFSVMDFPPTRVTIDIAAQLGGSEIVLKHEGVWAEYADRTIEGWTKILGNLATALATADSDSIPAANNRAEL